MDQIAPFLMSLRCLRPRATTAVLMAALALGLGLPSAEVRPDANVVEVLPSDLRWRVYRLSEDSARLERELRALRATLVAPGSPLDRARDRTPALARGEARLDRALMRARGRDQAPRGDMERDLATAEARLQRLNEAAELLKQSIAERRVMADSLPLARPVNGIVTSAYGVRKSPFTGKTTVHEGVDLAAPKGSVIVAPGAGTVRTMPNHKQFGNVVFIDHGFGVTTVFAHLSRIDVKTGDKVRRGQILGLIGTSGHSTGPHLHYEVHVDGQPVDPAPYLSADFGQLVALTPLPNT